MEDSTLVLGKYQSLDIMKDALDARGAEVVTVAIRRANIGSKSGESLLDHIDKEKYVILPNTAGCYSADETVRTAFLAREYESQI